MRRVTEDGGNWGSSRHDVVDQLNLCIKAAQEYARTPAKVAGNGVVDEKRASRARRRTDVEAAPAAWRPVAGDEVLDDVGVRLVDGVNAATFVFSAVATDRVVEQSWGPGREEANAAPEVGGVVEDRIVDDLRAARAPDVDPAAALAAAARLFRVAVDRVVSDDRGGERDRDADPVGARGVRDDDIANNGGRGAADVDSRAFVSKRASRIAVLEGESLKHSGRGLRGREVDHRREVGAVDGGHARPLGALAGDHLALEVDVLEIRTGGNQDRVPIDRRIDRGLHGP